MTEESTDLIALAVEVVSSYVSQNNIRPDDMPAFIASTYAAIKALDTSSTPELEAPAEATFEPAVTARKSLASPDHIISLIDGKPYKTLKRHLATNGLTPAEYRQRYGLKADYPMVAPSYSETRKALAQKIGLGRKAKDVVSAVVEAAEDVVEKVVSTRGRKPAAAQVAVKPAVKTARPKRGAKQA